MVLAARVNDSLIRNLSNIPRFKEFQRIHANKLHNHFYVIVMPNTLHYLLVCLKLIPKSVNVLLLLNGIDPWEEEYLRKQCGDYPVFELARCPKSSLSHGSVLNLLIDQNDANFGVLDHDMFVLNHAVFDNLSIEKNEFAIGAFKLRNKKAGLEFPTTQFLFFNIEWVKRIRTKYRVGAQEYFRIPRRLKPYLESLNLGQFNFLKEYMDYFDSMNMLFALAFYEKLSFKFLEACPDDFFHIGGTSGDNVRIPQKNYIGSRLLELLSQQELTTRYSFLYERVPPNPKRSRDLSENPPPTLIAAAGVEKAISKIQKRL